MATSGRGNLRITEASRQAVSQENVSGGPGGDRFIETQIFQPGTPLAQKVVPALAVTNTLEITAVKFRHSV